MRVKITKRYYKRSRKGKSPATYRAKQPKGVGTTVHARVRLAPVLKKHPDLRKLIMRHERNELRAWGEGMSRQMAHRKAQRATKSDDHIDTNQEFWGVIKKRRA